MAILCIRNASGYNYWNSSFIMDVAMGQIPRSTERIYSIFLISFAYNIFYLYSVSILEIIFNFHFYFTELN